MAGAGAMLQRTATPRRMWLALVALALVTFGAIALHAATLGTDHARLPIVPEPHWGHWLRFRLYEPMGLLSLAAPLIAAAALFFGKWRRPSLALLAFCALFQLAALGFELRWKQQECAGEFDRDLPGGIVWESSKPPGC